MTHPIDKPIRKKNAIVLFCKGLAMGTADIIPGVSGGTIAFLLGIYEQFIGAIKSFDLKFVQNVCKFQFKDAFANVAWKFMAALLSGIAVAIVLLSKILEWLLVNKPIFLNAFFFGLICATVPIIARILKRWSAVNIILLIIASIAAYCFVQLVPIQTPESLWFLFLCGMIAISAMILPGISGSFLLLILGKYQFVIQAINDRDLVSIAAIGCGVLVGVVTFVRVLSWLFKKYHDQTVALLTGLVIGSLNKIWPWKETLSFRVDRHGETVPLEQINIMPPAFDGDFFISVALMLTGFVFAILFNRSSDTNLEDLDS